MSHRGEWCEGKILNTLDKEYLIITLSILSSLVRQVWSTGATNFIVGIFLIHSVDLGGPVVITLASESEVRGFDPGRGRCIFSDRENPEYDFLRKGSKAVGPVS